MGQETPERNNTDYAVACVVAVLGLILIMVVDPGSLGNVLSGSILSVHTLFELVAIVVAALVVIIAWQTFGVDKEQPSNIMVGGFMVVMSCDVLHTLTYKGMPPLFRESDTEIAIFFWLAGRAAEAATMLLIAIRWVPRVGKVGAALVGGALSLILLVTGNFYIDELPDTFVEGEGVTPLKSALEYFLCAVNLGIAVTLANRARNTRRAQDRLLALSCFMMAVGGMAFTSYVAPSDFQNIAGHIYKVIAYGLLCRATFIYSIKAPYEALHESQAKVREFTERVATIGRNLPQAVIYQAIGAELDERRLVYLSDSAIRVFGVDPEAAIRNSSDFYRMVHPEDRTRFAADIRNSSIAMSQLDSTVRFIRPDGSVRTFNAKSQPRRIDELNVIWDGVFLDITDRVELEVSRRQMQDAINEANKRESIGTLASGIAHDFNNILGSIIGNTSMAVDDIEAGEKERAIDALRQVNRASSRARELVKQILTFSRKQVVERSPVNLKRAVEEGMGLLKSTLPAHVSMHADLDDAYVLADSTQIQQIILNLCTNAWQAMKGSTGQIDIGLNQVNLTGPDRGDLNLPSGAYARLSFSDDGCGMDAETRRRVFEPFFTTKPVGAGTGLGMAVVHGIVRAHGGAIAVDSDVGRGTRFDIYLPLITPTEAEGEEKFVTAHRVAGMGERVLYVDDDELMAMMVEGLLERAGYIVTVCRDPSVAIKEFRARPTDFDIVVTDFNMPAISGLDVIERIKQARSDIPALLTTGFVTDEVINRGSAIGAFKVLEKQHSLEQLPGEIARALRLAHDAEGSSARPCAAPGDP